MGQTTINGSRAILGTWDASGASKTVPIKSGTLASRPATCTANTEMYNVTNPAVSGQSLYICNSAGNGWSLVGDGGAGGGGDVTQSGANSFTGANDFSGASSVKPFKSGTFASLPGTCTAGDSYHATDITTGHGIFICSAANTWRAVGGASLAANAGVTGTTQYKLAKYTGAPSTAVVASTSDTSGIVGVVVSPGGTTGNALIAHDGDVPCVFDGATTAGNYVQSSSMVEGACHDAGAAYPTSGQVLGRVLSTNASGGNFLMALFAPEIRASSGGGVGGVALAGSPGSGQLCFDGTQLVGPRNGTCGFDDFLGGGTSNYAIGQHGWSFNAFGSCTNNMSPQTSDSEEYGILRFGCATNNAQQGMSITMGKWGAMTNRTNWRIAYGFRLGQVGGNRFRAGFTANQSSNAPTSFLGLASDDDAAWDTSGSGVGNFKMLICDGNTDITRCDVYNTGVAQDTNPHHFSVSSTAPGTYSMTFDSITKTFCASGCDVTTSHIPATSVEFWPGWIMGSSSAASKSAYAHWFMWYAALSR